ncbi:MAG: ABC transporter ATP-binding protein [Bacteroidales bacterium]|nr:ABC transporter ATP-binding protein [Bacteroidales bacterium]
MTTQSGDTAIITAHNISYSTHGTEILHNMSFNIRPRSLTGIIGMNGSGKTTLMKLLCNLINPSSGEINLKDKPLNSYSRRELSKNISMVFQNNPTDFDFSALQIVLMGRMPYQKMLSRETDEDFAACKQAMCQTQTWHLRNRNINSLSGGEKQRIFIARSLAQHTDVLLLDEPVANLDIKHQYEIMNLLKDIQSSRSATVVTVLHDLSLALKYSDYILALKQGNLFMIDNTEKVLTPGNISLLFEVSAGITDDKNVIITK